MKLWHTFACAILLGVAAGLVIPRVFPGAHPHPFKAAIVSVVFACLYGIAAIFDR